MNIRRIINTTLALGLTLGTLMTAALPASADPGWVPNHPAVDQVNARRDTQYSAIRYGARSGQLSGWEQRNLWARERQIGREEQTMRYRDGGHLTAYDSNRLNRQLNNTSWHLRRDEGR